MARGGGMPAGIPGMPGLPGMGGGRRAKAKQQPKKGKGKRVSGNPAKRAAQAKAATERSPASSGNPFGVPDSDSDVDLSDLDLPADLSKYLK
jgi:signal recognition particle subunit SRP54